MAQQNTPQSVLSCLRSVQTGPQSFSSVDIITTKETTIICNLINTAMSILPATDIGFRVLMAEPGSQAAVVAYSKTLFLGPLFCVIVGAWSKVK